MLRAEEVGNESFAVVLADDIIDAEVPCLKQMIEIYNETGCSVLATQVVEGPGDLLLWCARREAGGGQAQWAEDSFEVRDLVEKPKLQDAPSNLAIIGRYILDADDFRDAYRYLRTR